MRRPDGRRLPVWARRSIGILALVFGVSFVSFVLTVQFGPEPTWELLSHNPTEAEIAEIRSELGLDQALARRYADYLQRLITLNLGHSLRTGEPVRQLLSRTLPVTLVLILPGFLIGLVLALAAAMLAAWQRGRLIDRCLNGLSGLSMSLSMVILIVGLQALFGVMLGWFPVRGWAVTDLASYLAHVAVPSLALILAQLGYNLRFFRALFIAQLDADHVLAARAFGAGPVAVMLQQVLPNCLLAIVTRALFSLPPMLVAGSLLLENHFGIPGLGRVSFNATVSGDQPVLMAIVSLSALLFALIVIISDQLYRLIDPRVIRAESR